MFISNSSTLILLAKIRLFQKFIDYINQLIIPQQVYEEFIEKETSFDTLLIKKEINNKKIIVKSVEEDKYQKILNEFKLHKGEAAAFVLFDKNNHKAILTDDGELIKLCKLERIPFICSMAIVISLYNKKLILKKEALEKIDRLYEIGRYSKQIYTYFKEKVNSNGNNICKN
ncbi:hypothetical protein JXB41_06990 [Candidatus Woesearchaeota archaeon]|nr:hypothetical protein [Candidatus Woesearchaeota archaeon]